MVQLHLYFFFFFNNAFESTRNCFKELMALVSFVALLINRECSGGGKTAPGTSICGLYICSTDCVVTRTVTRSIGSCSVNVSLWFLVQHQRPLICVWKWTSIKVEFLLICVETALTRISSSSFSPPSSSVLRLSVCDVAPPPVGSVHLQPPLLRLPVLQHPLPPQTLPGLPPLCCSATVCWCQQVRWSFREFLLPAAAATDPFSAFLTTRGQAWQQRHGFRELWRQKKTKHRT